MSFFVHNGAFFHLFISFNISVIPALKLIFGFHFSFNLISLLSAYECLGSPGLSGIKIFEPPIILAKKLIFIGFAEPKLNIFPLNVVVAAKKNPLTTSFT